jgi:hypothetical protein
LVGVKLVEVAVEALLVDDVVEFRLTAEPTAVPLVLEQALLPVGWLLLGPQA